MKKVWILLVILCLAFTASAGTPLVVDNAGLLTAEQEQLLTQQLEGIRSELGIDVVILTENKLDGSNIKDYADNYYDYNGYADDGALLLLDMEKRQLRISTAGSCIEPVDAEVLAIQFIPYLKDGKYYEGFSLYAELVQEAIIKQYGNPQTEAKASGWFDGLGIGLIVGLIIGGIVVAVMASSMKTVRPQKSAGDYVKDGSLELTRQEDRYLYQTVTRRAKPKNNSSGGTHRGSSGRIHGGGSGRF